MMTSALKLRIPAAERRGFRLLQLSNQLRCLLVSDEDAEKGAAAVDVHVGSAHDPAGFPGLAHFCEHMLFLGTRKYPQENHYAEFLSQHGGHSNAYTAGTHTNYFFEVGTQQLPEAVDIFAQFFIDPLFTPSGTEREIHAVDSENKKNLQSDGWRLHQLTKSFTNPRHSYHKFGTGNLVTLLEEPKSRGDDVREALLEFHSRYYSANGMGLCVVGRQSLDELQQMVERSFSSVLNKDVHVEGDSVPVMDSHLGRQYYVVPVKDTRSLTVIFPILGQRGHYRARPAHYLSHLIGHEGPGSVLSMLMENGWATGLSAGDHGENEDFSLFEVSVELTPAGLEHQREVLRVLFQYIQLLRKSGPQEWVFQELSALAKQKFEFLEKSSASSTASTLAHALLRYEPEDALSGAYLVEEYRPDLIGNVLECLRPENSLVLSISQTYQDRAPLREKWYDTAYGEVTDDAFGVKALALEGESLEIPAALHLPHANPFIAQQLALKSAVSEEEKSDLPSCVWKDLRGELWYAMDHYYRVPRADFRAQLILPHSRTTAGGAFLSRLLCELVIDDLREYAYDATLAGLSYRVQPTVQGLEVRVTGFDEKLPNLVETVLQRLRQASPSLERFEVFKEKVLRELDNVAFDQPYNHARTYLWGFLSDTTWPPAAQSRAGRELTLPDLQKYLASQLFDGGRVEMLYAGNVGVEEARSFSEKVVSITDLRPLEDGEARRPRATQLEKGTEIIYQAVGQHSENENSVLWLHYQMGELSLEKQVEIELMAQVMDDSFFDQLRTKEQLGYIVSAGTQSVLNTMGLRFLIQSPLKDPVYLHARVDEYLKGALEALESMDEATLENHRQALITGWTERPKKLHQRTATYWDEISSGKYEFERNAKLAGLIHSVSRDNLAKRFRHELVGAEPAAFAIHIFGKGKPVSEPSSHSDSNRIRKILPSDISRALFRETLQQWPSC